MKVLVIILIILATTKLHSQNKPESELNFQIFCGHLAQTSKDIRSFKEIIDLKDTAFILKKLLKGSKLEQILSAITLKYYQASIGIELTKVEQKRLNQISRS